MVPQPIIAEVMKTAPSDRVHVQRKGDSYFLRISGKPLIDVTEFLNKYPLPETKSEIQPDQEDITPIEQQASEIHEHTRIQGMLVQFGRAAGYSAWVPTSDKHKEYNGESLSSLTISHLPNFGFDPQTNQIVANIDVLWFEGNVIHKAFEIESTTTVYSGLLRMSDLVLSQPNIVIELHIVAPLRRRDLVRKNILRPSFARLRPKCSYVSFEEVSTKYSIVKEILKKPQARIRDLLESEKF